MVQGIGERFHRLFPFLWFQLALPYRDAVPPHGCQPLLVLYIPFLVPANLVHPELPVRLRNLTALRIGKYVFTPLALWRGVGGEAPMSMPEAPVHKDARAILPQYQIRMPWQSLMVQSVSESPLPQSTAHNHLRLRILPSDRRHVCVSLLWSEFIHIELIVSVVLRTYSLAPLNHNR